MRQLQRMEGVLFNEEDCESFALIEVADGFEDLLGDKWRKT